MVLVRKAKPQLHIVVSLSHCNQPARLHITTRRITSFPRFNCAPPLAIIDLHISQYRAVFGHHSNFVIDVRDALPYLPNCK